MILEQVLGRPPHAVSQVIGDDIVPVFEADSERVEVASTPASGLSAEGVQTLIDRAVAQDNIEDQRKYSLGGLAAFWNSLGEL